MASTLLGFVCNCNAETGLCEDRDASTLLGFVCNVDALDGRGDHALASTLLGFVCNWTSKQHISAALITPAKPSNYSPKRLIRFQRLDSRVSRLSLRLCLAEPPTALYDLSFETTPTAELLYTVM